MYSHLRGNAYESLECKQGIEGQVYSTTGMYGKVSAMVLARKTCSCARVDVKKT